MLGRELRALQGAGAAFAEEGVHLRAEIAQAHARIARRPPGDEFADDVVEAGIVVMQPLEGDQRAEQRSGLARFHAGREQEQQRIEIVLLGHDPVLAQILRDHGRRNAEVRIGAGAAVEAGRQQGQLVGIGDRIARRHMAEAVPAGAGRELPVAGIGRRDRRSRRLPRRSRAPRAIAAGDGEAIGHEDIEEPAPRRVLLLVLELAPDRPHLLAQLDAEPDGVVPQHLAGPPLHHLRADVERGEQRIERRGRGVQHEELVEAAMLDAPALALDVAVLDVDLRGLGEARELLVGRLRRHDAGTIRAEIGEAHGDSGRHRADGTS